MANVIKSNGSYPITTVLTLDADETSAINCLLSQLPEVAAPEYLVQVLAPNQLQALRTVYWRLNGH